PSGENARARTDWCVLALCSISWPEMMTGAIRSAADARVVLTSATKNAMREAALSTLSPVLRGEGRVRGRDAPFGVIRFRAHRRPLTPILSPEYRGEGE